MEIEIEKLVRQGREKDCDQQAFRESKEVESGYFKRRVKIKNVLSVHWEPQRAQWNGLGDGVGKEWKKMKYYSNERGEKSSGNNR